MLAILKFLTPTNFLIAAFIALATFGWYEHRQVAKLNQAVVHQEQVIEKQDKNLAILNKDKQFQDEFQGKKNSIVDRQKNFNNAQSKIPNSTTDHPFSNPDLLNAARQLRDYQQSSFNSDPGNSTNSNPR